MKNTAGGFCRRLLCSFVAAVPVVATFAVEPDEGRVIRLGETVVTPTRTETPLENVGSTVTVVTREEIENSQSRAVTDVLRKVPGVFVVQSGPPGSQASVFTRGTNSNQTLFLIDGARVGSPLNGLVTLSNLTTDQVERIEIVRGPQSTVYGADALGGVINIVTKKGEGPLSGIATLEGGTYESFRQAVDIRGAGEKFSGALSLSHISTENAYPNQRYENLTLGGSTVFHASDTFQITGTFRYSNGRNGVPGPVAVFPPNLTERLEDETLFARIAFDWTLFDIWHQTFSISENHEQLDDTGNPFVESSSTSDVLQIGWQHTVKLCKDNTVTAGIDWYLNNGRYETIGATPFDESINNTAFYLQDQAVLFDRLALTGGFRYDENSRFDGHFTARGAGVLRFDETRTRIKGSVGSGFKAPTLNDLFLSFPAFAFVGNPNLQPEKSLGWDIGIEQDLGKRATFEVRYFENDLRNLIAPGTLGANFSQVNIDKARTDGIEAGLQVHPTDDLTLFASYTWLHEAKNLTTNARLLRRPEHTGTVGLNWHFFDRWNLNTSATLVSERADLDPATFGPTTTDPYVKWDAALSFDVCKNFRVFCRVENIIGEDYQEASGYPALGRVVWGGFTAKF